MKLNLDLNAWSIGTTLVALTAAVAYMQADVSQLKAEDGRLGKRLEVMEIRSERDRDTLSTMQGDIRVMRQILENGRLVPAPQFVPHLSPVPRRTWSPSS